MPKGEMILVTWFPCYAVVDFLRNYFNQIDKYNELFAAVLFSKWQSEITGIPDLPIGIPVLNKMSLRSANEMVTLEQIKNVVDKMKQDYSTVDIVVSNVAFEAIDSTPRPFGWNFQIKQFQLRSRKHDLTSEFVSYINDEIPRKYPTKDSATRLLVILEIPNKVDLSKAKEQIIWDKFPFSELHFVYFRDDKAFLGEVWPEQYVFSVGRKSILGWLN